MKLSIIVPVFNTADYLVECLDSLVRQSLGDKEVICVDNGSTDSSLQVLEDYASQYSFVKVFQHPEGRQGAARNYGLSRASGEYCGFVDSDDFVESDMFERLVIDAEHHGAEMAVCNMRLFYQDSGLSSVHLPPAWLQGGAVSVHQRPQLFRNLTICNKIFRRSFLEENSICFPEDTFHEDQFFVVNAYSRASQIAVVPEVLYHYRKQREGSVSESGAENAFEIFEVVDSLCKHLESLKEEFYLLVSRELAVSRYLQQMPGAGLGRRAYFEEMKARLPHLAGNTEPLLLTESELRAYRFISTHGYNTFNVRSTLVQLARRIPLSRFARSLYQTILQWLRAEG